MVSSFFAQHSRLVDSSPIFHCFEQVIILDKFWEQVAEVKQKIIIRNNNLLFQFSDHNNNLLVLNLWKSTRSVIIFNKVSGLRN